MLLYTYIRCQTHHTGYGQCSSLRLVDENGSIHCCLVLGKARVAPLRSVTIPGFELTSATVLVRVANVLKEELDYEEPQDFYWTEARWSSYLLVTNLKDSMYTLQTECS